MVESIWVNDMAEGITCMVLLGLANLVGWGWMYKKGWLTMEKLED